MEENVVIGHQLTPSSTASDVNFSDVFGGPPRRSSMYETRQRYSFADTDDQEEETLPYRGMGEKPVFGEGSSNHRRRRRGNDFYNDIFRSDESSSSTPMKQHDPYGSAPGSRLLSPVKPDPFGTSVPSPFSLSPKLPKAMDLPTFGSPPRSSPRSKDQASEGINSSPSTRATLSRFSSQSIQDQESKNDVHSFYSQSSLSLSTEELPSAVLTKNATNSSEVLGDGLPFHFSIYKWASKGAPMMMPLRSSRIKQMAKTEAPSSLNVEGELTTATPHDTHKPSFVVKRDDDLLLSPITPSRQESSQMVEEQSSSLPQPATVEDVPSVTILHRPVEKMKPNSHFQVGFGGKPNKATPAPVQVTLEINDLNPLSSLLNDSIEQDDDSKLVKSGRNKSNEKAFVEKNQAGKKVIKKHEEKQDALTDTEVDKAGVEGSPKKPGKSLARNRVKGKMKEFVKIFNHEVSSKTKTVVDPKTQSQSCRWNATFRPENEASRHVADMDQKLHPHPNKEVALKEATITELKNVTPSEVEEYLKQSEKRYSATKTDKFVPSDTSQPEYTSVSSTASVPDVSNTVIGDTDDSFHQDFVIEELPLEKNDKPLPDKDHEDKQVIDTKIRKWLSGKEGNIRSLLSTLQYVLWPESGWKPVPLVNIIEGNAVKRAYQRALLCLHPDKLQQKGAASDQKYIAEKVFDILQEAWTQFNALGSL